MTFLPIVERELIEASRRRGTYWLRVGVAAAGLAIGAWVMLFPELRVPSRLGRYLFIPLATITQIYCLLVGVFRTADCLSAEKREGTLGLLFLTDLKGYDIVFGKLAATSLNALYGLLAIFPVLAIPLLAGGVALPEFGRVVLVCLNNLFFSLAVGMFCSAFNRNERGAMIDASAILFLITVGLPVLSMIASSRGWAGSLPLAEWLLVPSPGFAAFAAFDEPNRISNLGIFFPWSVGAIHLLGWALLLGASLIVPKAWQDKPPGPFALRRLRLWQRLDAGPAEDRRARRQHRLDINPICWLVTRRRRSVLALWAVLVLGAAAWTLGLTLSPRDWRNEVAYVFTGLCGHTVLKLWVATEACRRFSLDRESGALELILSTPLPVREIVRGQLHGLERQFAGPMFVVLLSDLSFLMAKSHDLEWVVLWGVGMVVFVADVFTLSWVGMWRGLNNRRPNRAAAVGIGQVLLLPWILFALALTFIDLFGISAGVRSRFVEDNGLALLFLGISLAVDTAFGLPAQRRLYSSFRRIVTERFASRKSGLRQ